MVKLFVFIIENLKQTLFIQRSAEPYNPEINVPDIFGYLQSTL